MNEKTIAEIAWLDVSGETHPPSPGETTADSCSLCGWPAARTFSLLRAGQPPQAICTLCWMSQNLDTPSAAQGVLSWLPGMKPADVINLQRLALIAALAGTKDQQKHGRRVLRWLRRHKTEAERYWATSRPAEFAAALTRLHPEERCSLRRQLRGTHLIMPASTFTDLTLLLPAGTDAASLLHTYAFPNPQEG